MARTAKKKIPIYDEGVLLIDDANSLNFAGVGVTGSLSGSDVTETVPGGSGAVTVTNEVVVFTGTTGTLASTPVLGTVVLTRGGIQQQPGAGKDYTISGAAITLAVDAGGSEVFMANYQK